MSAWGWVAIAGAVAAGALLWFGRSRVTGALAAAGEAVDPVAGGLREQAEGSELEAKLRRLAPNLGELSVTEGAALTPRAAHQICMINRRAMGLDPSACEELLTTLPEPV